MRRTLRQVRYVNPYVEVYRDRTVLGGLPVVTYLGQNNDMGVSPWRNMHDKHQSLLLASLYNEQRLHESIIEGGNSVDIVKAIL